MDSMNRKTDKYKVSQSKSNKKYKKTEKGKASTLKAKQKYRKTIKGKLARKIINKNYRVCHPNQIMAQQAANNAIAVGRMRRPDSLLCRYCLKPAEQYHHWHGYAPEHWLDVIPVCQKCHRKIHKKSA